MIQGRDRGSPSSIIANAKVVNNGNVTDVVGEFVQCICDIK